MLTLLAPGADGAARPALTWTSRQAREQRRRDMLQLQRWVEVGTERLTRDVATGDGRQGGPAPEALAAAAAKGRELYDQAIEQLVRHVAEADGGSAGGGDEASEVLAEVWRGYSGLARRVQDGMRREVEAARRRADSAEARADEVRKELARRQSAGGAAAAGAGADDCGRASDGGAEPGQRRNAPGAAQAREEDVLAAKAHAETACAAAAELQRENARLAKAAAAAARELACAQERAAALEAAADEAADAEARARAAEAERDAALQERQALTPRPAQAHLELRALAGPEGAAAALAALAANTALQPAKVAQLLVDEGSDTTAASTSAADAYAALAAHPAGGPPPEQPAAAPPLGLPPPPAPSPFRGALRGVPPLLLAEALSRTVGPTAVRYAALEADAAALRAEAAALRAELETHREAERRREAARRRRDDEAQLERKNPLQQYLDLLTGQGEAAWKEFLIGMGQGPEVPRLFRHAGKVRNKHMSKRDTEKLLKEIWRERAADPAVAGGRAGELVDFVGTHLQKKVGIAAAVLEVRSRVWGTVEELFV
jgi:hypothetical protein